MASGAPVDLRIRTGPRHAGARHGRVFTVDVDDERVWDRASDGGFPDAATLKRLVRDSALPDWNLGHGERP